MKRNRLDCLSKKKKIRNTNISLKNTFCQENLDREIPLWFGCE